MMIKGPWIPVGIGIAVAVYVALSAQDMDPLSPQAPKAAFDVPPSCPVPGYMVVTGGIEDPATVADPERARSYGPAVWALVDAYGAHYLTRARVEEVIEGEWPDWRAVVISKWGCRETGTAFWYSDAYQNDVKPRREGAGVYVVGMFDEASQDGQSGTWIESPADCSAPVLSFTEYWTGSVTDRAAVSDILADPQIGSEFGAISIVSGAPEERLEGEWPATYGLDIRQWPCEAAFKAALRSNAYQVTLNSIKDIGVRMNVIWIKSESGLPAMTRARPR